MRCSAEAWAFRLKCHEHIIFNSTMLLCVTENAMKSSNDLTHRHVDFLVWNILLVMCLKEKKHNNIEIICFPYLLLTHRSRPKKKNTFGIVNSKTSSIESIFYSLTVIINNNWQIYELLVENCVEPLDIFPLFHPYQPFLCVPLRMLLYRSCLLFLISITKSIDEKKTV